ncbi:sterol desaturase family protein [Nocardioides ferulae]|uniref:sterol desaturase family protein n=1 Tax=Nocardioides ferulae TaxID=2340821 RepID=UPI00197E8E80|nr:sterol desaturase family protein [Nocardioides ferulae]
MTKVDPRVEELAARRVAADEQRITGPRRTPVSLRQAWRSFWRHPSPWLLTTGLVGSVAARFSVGGGAWWELAVPAGLVALLPVVEWVVHVCILHWRPRRVGPVTVDPLLSRKHRAHHADPRAIPLVFVPWQVELWLFPAYVGVAWLVMPTTPSMLTLLVSVFAIMSGYEWTHYLLHSDYRPRSRWYRAVWRNHRLHHYKSEHYWFTVTTAGTADRLFGTCPDPATVPTSPTVRALHATDAH